MPRTPIAMKILIDEVQPLGVEVTLSDVDGLNAYRTVTFSGTKAKALKPFADLVGSDSRVTAVKRATLKNFEVTFVADRRADLSGPFGLRVLSED